ncbi:MAG: hypothetical protein U0169_26210 [Polyangiaceae bacterium]
MGPSTSRKHTLGASAALVGFAFSSLTSIACGAPDPGSVDLSASRIERGADGRPDPGGNGGTAGTSNAAGSGGQAGTAGTGAAGGGTGGTSPVVDAGSPADAGPGPSVDAGSTPDVATPSGPSIQSFSPVRAATGGMAFSLTALGSGFDASCTLMLGSTALTTSFISSTALTANVVDSLLVVAGTMPVSVRCGAQSVSSNTLFAVEGPPPTPVMGSITPDTIKRGSAAVVVRVVGSSFSPSSQVVVYNAMVATKFVSNTLLEATVPANLLSVSGQGPLFVRTPSGAQSLNSMYATLTIVE